MFNTQLFFGLPLEDFYQHALDQLSLSERELFIQNQHSPYLQQIESEGILYLGKYLGSFIELTTLDSLQAHIYSLLNKLVPNYPYKQHPLLLLAIPSED